MASTTANKIVWIAIAGTALFLTVHCQLVSELLDANIIRDKYENVLQEYFANYSHYASIYYASVFESPVQVHFSNIIISDFQHQGFSEPFVTMQLEQTLSWQDDMLVAWAPYNLFNIRKLHISLNPTTEDPDKKHPIVSVRLQVSGAESVERLQHPNDLVIFNDGRVQLTRILNINMRLWPVTSSSAKDFYPNDRYYTTLHFYTSNDQASDQDRGGLRRTSRKLLCSRLDVDRDSCDMGESQGLSLDRRWNYVVRAYESRYNNKIIRMNIYMTRNRARNLPWVNRRQKGNNLSTLIEMSHDAMEAESNRRWAQSMARQIVNEGTLPMFCGFMILAQCLIPTFMREKFIVGVFNLLSMMLCLQHYDAIPALFVDDGAPCVNFYCLVMSLQLVAMVWFCGRSLLFYNSAISLGSKQQAEAPPGEENPRNESNLFARFLDNNNFVFRVILNMAMIDTNILESKSRLMHFYRRITHMEANLSGNVAEKCSLIEKIELIESKRANEELQNPYTSFSEDSYMTTHSAANQAATVSTTSKQIMEQCLASGAQEKILFECKLQLFSLAIDRLVFFMILLGILVGYFLFT